MPKQRTRLRRRSVTAHGQPASRPGVAEGISGRSEASAFPGNFVLSASRIGRHCPQKEMMGQSVAFGYRFNVYVKTRDSFAPAREVLSMPISCLAVLCSACLLGPAQSRFFRLTLIALSQTQPASLEYQLERKAMLNFVIFMLMQPCQSLLYVSLQCHWLKDFLGNLASIKQCSSWRYQSQKGRKRSSVSFFSSFPFLSVSYLFLMAALKLNMGSPVVELPPLCCSVPFTSWSGLDSLFCSSKHYVVDTQSSGNYFFLIFEENK